MYLRECRVRCGSPRVVPGRSCANIAEKEKFMTKQGCRVKYTLVAKDNLPDEGLKKNHKLIIIINN